MFWAWIRNVPVPPAGNPATGTWVFVTLSGGEIDTKSFAGVALMVVSPLGIKTLKFAVF